MEEFKTKYSFMRLSKESDSIKLEFLSYVCSSGWLSLFAILRVFEWTERSNRTHMGFLCITSYRLQVKIGFWHTRETFVYCFAWSIAYVLEYQKLKSFIYPNIYRNIILKNGKKPCKDCKFDIYCAVFSLFSLKLPQDRNSFAHLILGKSKSFFRHFRSRLFLLNCCRLCLLCEKI